MTIYYSPILTKEDSIFKLLYKSATLFREKNPQITIDLIMFYDFNSTGYITRPVALQAEDKDERFRKLADTIDMIYEGMIRLKFHKNYIRNRLAFLQICNDDNLPENEALRFPLTV